jgi:FtsP/CotA-like multicopper oxidase with cupredoxin domain
MNRQSSPGKLSRRDFLRLAGSVGAGAALLGAVPGIARKFLWPVDVARAAGTTPDLYFAGTDGWAYFPPTPVIPPYHPDPAAPAPFNIYTFGFRNIFQLGALQKAAQKGQAQISAPIWWVNEGQWFTLGLTNLGLKQRPDLFDAHTVHWHGFKNQIPYFDGEPMSSMSVPEGSEVLYAFHPLDAGTYPFHCHVEDMEHIHMGMTGGVHVRPLQNGMPYTYLGKTYTKFVYNDAVDPVGHPGTATPGITGYDREYLLLLTDAWAKMHWNDAHIQATDWTDFKPDFFEINGRVYPDTIAPNGGGINMATGDLIAPAGRPELQQQPHSSLIQCNAGDRVCLRFVQLGYKFSTMTLPGLKLKVVGKSASMLRGSDGTDLSYETNTLYLGAGDAVEALFMAPASVPGPGPTKYYLFNRGYDQSNNLDSSAGGPGYGGQMTEIWVWPAGTLPAQQLINDLPLVDPLHAGRNML